MSVNTATTTPSRSTHQSSISSIKNWFDQLIQKISKAISSIFSKSSEHQEKHVSKPLRKEGISVDSKDSPTDEKAKGIAVQSNLKKPKITKPSKRKQKLKDPLQTTNYKAGIRYIVDSYPGNDDRERIISSYIKKLPKEKQEKAQAYAYSQRALNSQYSQFVPSSFISNSYKENNSTNNTSRPKIPYQQTNTNNRTQPTTPRKKTVINPQPKSLDSDALKAKKLAYARRLGVGFGKPN